MALDAGSCCGRRQTQSDVAVAQRRVALSHQLIIVIIVIINRTNWFVIRFTST